mgnify:CR=1 FL=1
MIEIIKEGKVKKNKKPYYKLRYNYMIGDGKGNTSETVRISVDNPYLERYVKLLNSLTPVKGCWGIVFEDDRIYSHYEEGQITKDDYYFLNRLMNEEYYENLDEDMEDEEGFVVEKENEEFASEFFDGVRGETEYSFLVFEGIDLFYYDEEGKKNKTKISK